LSAAVDTCVLAWGCEQSEEGSCTAVLTAVGNVSIFPLPSVYGMLRIIFLLQNAT